MYAMELLLGDMVKLGSTRKHLRAKVFGGGTGMATGVIGAGVADRNARFAFEYLRSEGIPVDSSDVGGRTARRLLFLPVSAKVLLKRIPWGQRDLVAAEERYSRQLDETTDTSGDVTLF
jgi:chemotaxis protein CheD